MEIYKLFLQKVQKDGILNKKWIRFKENYNGTIDIYKEKNESGKYKDNKERLKVELFYKSNKKFI